MNQILKIGHRGAKGYVAENTLASFEKALYLGVDGIELDVRLSSDEKIIVIHDQTIDRTSTGKGFAKDFTALELQQFGISTLDEVLDLVNKKCFVNIELKTFETAKKVVALVEKYIQDKNWKYDDFLISSFDWNALQEVSFLNEKIPIGVLTETDLDLAFAFSKFIKAKTINPYFHLLNAENITKIKEKNIKIYAWTVNQPEDITFVKSLHIDGIISDFPDRI
jgi:glycerophosphoryl diester phosphodiesterase